MIRYKLLGEKDFANIKENKQLAYKPQKSSFIIGKENQKKLTLEKIKAPPNTINIEFNIVYIPLENNVIIKSANESLVWKAGNERWQGAELIPSSTNYFNNDSDSVNSWKIETKTIKFILQNSPTIYVGNCSEIQLWPCGGRINDKNLIEQLYAETPHNLKLINLTVTTLEQWNNHGLYPQQEGLYLGKKVIFHYPYPSYRSLAEFINKGEVNATLKNNSGYVVNYQSIEFEFNNFKKTIVIRLERRAYDYLPN